MNGLKNPTNKELTSVETFGCIMFFYFMKCFACFCTGCALIFLITYDFDLNNMPEIFYSAFIIVIFLDIFHYPAFHMVPEDVEEFYMYLKEFLFSIKKAVKSVVCKIKERGVKK